MVPVNFTPENNDSKQQLKDELIILNLASSQQIVSYTLLCDSLKMNEDDMEESVIRLIISGK
jgi:hypothetical protein